MAGKAPALKLASVASSCLDSAQCLALELATRVLVGYFLLCTRFQPTTLKHHIKMSVQNQY